MRDRELAFAPGRAALARAQRPAPARRRAPRRRRANRAPPGGAHLSSRAVTVFGAALRNGRCGARQTGRRPGHGRSGRPSQGDPDEEARHPRDRARAHRSQGARLPQLAHEITLALERSQVVVDAVGRADAHVRPDLSEGGRVAAIGDRLADVVQNLLLTVGEALHRRAEATEQLGGCQNRRLSEFPVAPILSRSRLF